MLGTRRLLLLHTYFVLSSAWKSYEFVQIKASQYQITDTKNNLKSVVQCTNSCFEVKTCQGITFEHQKCHLFSNIIESKDETGVNILKLKYPEGKVSQIDFLTNDGTNEGTESDIGLGQVSHFRLYS